MVPTVHILILAAGASTRMRGADKLLEPVAGRPMLRHVARLTQATGSPVTVALPPDRPEREAALEGLALQRLPVPDAALGMSRGLVRGIVALEEAGPEDGLMVLPADMPGFTTPALAGLIATFRADPTRILRGGTEAGDPGHPVIFPRDLWPDLSRVKGDEGGRSVILANSDRVRVIALPDRMATLDLDTPEDWAAWRASRP
jgi:CTP:molybdopterin cytidylyltransferase MocA